MDPDPTTPYEAPRATAAGDAPPPPPGASPPPPPSSHGTWSTAGSGTGPPGAAGAPSAWDVPRRDQGNGCLRACLIVGALLVGLAVVGVIALAIIGGRVAEEFAENPDAFLGGPCPYVRDAELSAAVGEPLQAMALEGFADGTMGIVLDKRLLADAPDCWIVGESGFAARIAIDDGGGEAAFDAAVAAAEQGGFRGADAAGVGDEAVCTELSVAGSSGVLVRWGGRVAYASVVIDDPREAGNACALASAVAGTLAP